MVKYGIHGTPYIYITYMDPIALQIHHFIVHTDDLPTETYERTILYIYICMSIYILSIAMISKHHKTGIESATSLKQVEELSCVHMRFQPGESCHESENCREWVWKMRKNPLCSSNVSRGNFWHLRHLPAYPNAGKMHQWTESALA